MIPTRRLVPLTLLASALFTHPARSADGPGPVPLKVLLVSGGCCHDYPKQKDVIAKGLAERAFVEVTTVLQGGTTTDAEIPLYKDADWSKGYDVVIHDECFSDAKDPAWLDRVLAPHKKGLPAVVLHCAMHSYRTGGDDWFQFCGVTSRRHGAAYPHEVLNNDPKHPIMADFGPAWSNPAGELYWVEKLWPTARPLATSKNREKGNDEVCVWTNRYDKARVFGTTLGHHNETVGDPTYLNMLTRGVLWAADKLEPRYLKEARPDAPRVVPLNLARGRASSASSVEDGHPAKEAVDGNPSTRWCPTGGEPGQWLQIDLGGPTRLNGLKLDWESSAVYRYKVEGSRDAKAWTLLADGSKNAEPSPNVLKVGPIEARYVRVTFLGSSTNGWGSLREVEVHGDKTVTLDPKVAAGAKEAAQLAGVKVPDGFDVTVFAAPPAINYPVFVAAAPNGDVYVSSDRNGSLDREPHRGSVYRLRDLDGDGHADEVKRFVADVDSPRGLVWDHDRLYLMHPPHLSAYIDKDGDGVADEEKVLVKDIAFGFKDRPADHTSNGVTLGIDGWLYLAIGDFGFLRAEGTDGRTLQLRGGGVVRVRPDGTGLELYSRGTRNILEVGLDPLLNGFARDNTNDGGGWDIRFHHFAGMGEHGYPSLFKNFADEAIAPLADYGGGSGCGSLYLSEPGFPAGYGDAMYTADWGRDRIFRHRMTPRGATFTADQSEFMTVPRVTDLDVDALGHLYVSSWKGATFTFAGEDVGYILRVTPKGNKPEPLPDYAKMDKPGLIKALESASHRRRLEAQRELIRRGDFFDDPKAVDAFNEIMSTIRVKPLPARIAALFAMKQASGADSTFVMAMHANEPELREFALRAMTDRKDQLGDWNPQAISGMIDGDPDARLKAATAALVQNPKTGSLAGVPKVPYRGNDSAAILAVRLVGDSNPRVRRQAAVSLARIGLVEHAKALIPLLADGDPIVAHTAVQALISLKAADACFAAIDDPRTTAQARARALSAIHSIHESGVVRGLMPRIEGEADPSRRLGLIAALARLDHRDGFWRGDSWGTRPDTSGPYYQPEAWEETPKIEAALKSYFDRSSGGDFAAILRQLDRNKVQFAGMADALLARASKDPALVPAAVEHLAKVKDVPPGAIPLLAGVSRAKDRPAALRSEATLALLKVDGEEGLRAALIALAGLESEGRESPAFVQARDAFLASRLAPRRRIFEDLAAKVDGPASAWADAALIAIAAEKGRRSDARDAAAKAIESGWANPKRRAQILHAVAIVGQQSMADRVLSALGDPDPAVASAARDAAIALKLDPKLDASRPVGPKIEGLKLDAVLASAGTTRGEVATGERLFTRLNCTNCHTVRQSDPPKGPYLGTIATTYKRRELAEAILVPSKTLAQGFATNVFALEDGRTLTGFVVKEAADVVTLRDGEGKESQVPTAQIVERTKSDISVMPEGLVKGLTVAEFASLLDYLESLSAKGGTPK